MRTRIIDIASRVITRADRAHPADAVLRAELKQHRVLSDDAAEDIVAAVYSYYRWQGWLNTQGTVDEQIDRALDLARRFEDNPSTFSATELIEKAVPHWLYDEMEIDDAWVRGLQSPPTLWLRARPGKREDLAAKLGIVGSEPIGMLHDAIAYSGDRDLFNTVEFKSGEFEIQDLSSQAVAAICAPVPGQTWWDTCAGEGGKTLHLADLMKNRGLIWASDRAEWRLRRLKRRAARARIFNYRTALWDGGRQLPTRTKFDGILIDAPCSGVGTWQRNPHARWTTTPLDVQELAVVQRRLLDNAVGQLKPGGKLVYSVCTLTRSETVEIANGCTHSHPELAPFAVQNPLTPKATAEPQHWLRSPRANGMFIAVWQKR